MIKWDTGLEKKFNEIIEPYKNNEEVQKMKKFMQHGSISTYKHCMKVAKMCFYVNHKYDLHIDDETLVIGAFLHDFYLYDWHNCKHITKLHGFEHPLFAAINAKKVFNVASTVLDIIKSHMWPLTITKVPKNKAALLVCIVDKYVASKETIDGIKHKISHFI